MDVCDVMIELDGSKGEGGGQIVRTALAYSMLTLQPVTITNIRKGRKEPGLKNQHLHCVKTLQQLSHAKADGDELGSTKLIFHPAPLTRHNAMVDIGTAGSITLLLQAILLPCLFADKQTTLTIRGGTDTKWSSSFDYFREVFLPQLARFGKIECTLVKRGYYPKGGGVVELTITPRIHRKKTPNMKEFLSLVRKEVPSFKLDVYHHLVHVKGRSHASSTLQEARVAERQAEVCKSTLQRALHCPVSIQAEYTQTENPGSGITLWAIYTKDKESLNPIHPLRLGSDALGKRGKPSEEVGKEATDDLLEEIKEEAVVDKHLADNIVPFLALCGGVTKTSRITNHAKTNMEVVEYFLGRTFAVDGMMISVQA